MHGAALRVADRPDEIHTVVIARHEASRIHDLGLYLFTVREDERMVS